MHDYPCINCRREVLDNHSALACELCHEWCHIDCGTGVTQEQYQATVEGDNSLEWQCQGCLAKLAAKKKSVDNPNEISILEYIHRKPKDVWTIKEKLALASSVQKSGDQNWVSVSRCLKPFNELNRSTDWYSQRNCAMQYAQLLDKKQTSNRSRRKDGIEIPGDLIVKELTKQRMTELQTLIDIDKKKYTDLIWSLKLAEFKKMKRINPQLDMATPVPSPMNSGICAEEIANATKVPDEISPVVTVKQENNSPPKSVKARTSKNSISVDSMVDIVEALEASHAPSRPATPPPITAAPIDAHPPLSIEATLFDADIKIDIDTDCLIDEHIDAIDHHIEIDDINPLPLDLDLLMDTDELSVDAVDITGSSNSTLNLRPSDTPLTAASTLFITSSHGSSSTSTTTTTSSLTGTPMTTAAAPYTHQSRVPTLPGPTAQSTISSVQQGELHVKQELREDCDPRHSSTFQTCSSSSSSSSRFASDHHQSSTLPPQPASAQRTTALGSGSGSPRLQTTMLDEADHLPRESPLTKPLAASTTPPPPPTPSMKASSPPQCQVAPSINLDLVKQEEIREELPTHSPSHRDPVDAPIDCQLYSEVDCADTKGADTKPITSPPPPSQAPPSQAPSLQAPPSQTSAVELPPTPSVSASPPVPANPCGDASPTPAPAPSYHLHPQVGNAPSPPAESTHSPSAPPPPPPSQTPSSQQAIQDNLTGDHVTSSASSTSNTVASDHTSQQPLLHPIKVEDSEDKVNLTEQCQSIVGDILQDAIQSLAEQTTKQEIKNSIETKVKMEVDSCSSSQVSPRFENNTVQKHFSDSLSIKQEVERFDDVESPLEKQMEHKTKIKEQIKLEQDNYMDDKIKENGPLCNADLASLKSTESGVDSSAESMCTDNNGQPHCSRLPSPPSTPTSTAPASTPHHQHHQPHSSKPVKVDKQWKKEVMLLYQMIYNHKYSSIFLHMVTNVEAPGYTEMVYKPTCLLSIKKAIEKGVIRNIDQFEREVYLMFCNANMYNSDIALESDMAKEMFDEAKANIQSFRESQSFGKELGSSNSEDKNCKSKTPRSRKRPAESQDPIEEEFCLSSRIKDLRGKDRTRETSRDRKNSATSKSTKKENKRKSKK